MSEPMEPASYSPASATAAAAELWAAIQYHSGYAEPHVRKLIEVCYVINALAAHSGCPGNQSVDDYRRELLDGAMGQNASTETKDTPPADV